MLLFLAIVLILSFYIMYKSYYKIQELRKNLYNSESEKSDMFDLRIKKHIIYKQ